MEIGNGQISDFMWILEVIACSYKFTDQFANDMSEV